jgi:hypothetical protein
MLYHMTIVLHILFELDTTHQLLPFIGHFVGKAEVRRWWDLVQGDQEIKGQHLDGVWPLNENEVISMMRASVRSKKQQNAPVLNNWVSCVYIHVMLSIHI